MSFEHEDREPVDYGLRMAALARSFHCLAEADGVLPWDPHPMSWIDARAGRQTGAGSSVVEVVKAIEDMLDARGAMSPDVSSPYAARIDRLRSTRAAIKFLSLEPLLGPLRRLDLRGINWVIVGGESGPKARPMDSAWVLDIRDQCRRAKVPFFFKQWGGKNKKKAGRLLDGKTWDEMPARTPTQERGGSIRLPLVAGSGGRSVRA
jgi:Protein of unknown function (DUF5131)